MDPETTKPKTAIPPKGKPFLLRFTGISTAVMGSVGLLFFLMVFLLIISNPNFSHRFNDTFQSLTFFKIYLAIELVLHLLLIMAGLSIFKMKKNSLWLFPSAISGLLLFSWIVDYQLMIFEFIILFLFFIILIGYRKKLN